MKHFARITAIVITLSSFLWIQTAYAASATLYLSPSTSTAINGNVVTVSIIEDSGNEPVNAVQADFTYPASELQFVSINSTSAFSVVAQSVGGNGDVQIARGALPSVTGSQVVATVQFKAIASSGSAVLLFSGGTSVVSANSNTNILTANTGTSYTLQPVPQTSTGGSTGSSSSGSTKSTTKTSAATTPKQTTTATPAPPKDATPPTISNITVSTITTGSATLTWTTSEAASSEVDYGLTNGYGLSASASSLTTAHSSILNSPLIVPGTAYHFLIKATDAAGNTASSSDQIFTTKGASAIITVLNAKNGKPVTGAIITFDGKTKTTNTQGQASFTDLPIGNMVGTVAINGRQSIETLRVASLNPNSSPQAITFKLTAVSRFTSWLTTGSLVTILVVIAALFGFLVGHNNGILLRMRKVFQKREGKWKALQQMTNTISSGQSPFVLSKPIQTTTQQASLIIPPTNPRPLPMFPPNDQGNQPLQKQ